MKEIEYCSWASEWPIISSFGFCFVGLVVYHLLFYLTLEGAFLSETPYYDNR